MGNDGAKRGFCSAAAGGMRSRGALAAFCAFAAALLPACSGCQVDVERSDAANADGLFSGLVVGGSASDGAFVLARRARTPEDAEVVLVSLADGEKRTCSLGKAAWYDTARQRYGFLAAGQLPVDDRPGRALTLEGELGAKSGDLRVFDASCAERMRVPSVEASVTPIYGLGAKIEVYAARTTAGDVVFIDPWAGEVRTIAENASLRGYSNERLWLIEGGSLVVRDRDGHVLQTAGAGVTELAPAAFEDEVAYVDEMGLWVLRLGEAGPTAVSTPGKPCKPRYIFSKPLQLAYREDCAAGTLAVLDRTTGDKRVFSSHVTSVRSWQFLESSWLFFEREEPGQKRELWAVPEGGDPVLVGTDPKTDLFYALLEPHEDGFLVDLDDDGATGTLGKWTPDGNFTPLVEGFARAWNDLDYLAALDDAQGDIGTLVVLDKGTLAEVLRVPRVHGQTPRFARQAPALGYVRDWDDTLGAGTFSAWIPDLGQQIDVDTGVTEFGELFWPEPGVVYTVRTPERAGLWTAYPGL